MNILTYIIAGFSVLGAIDCILNNKFQLGKEWERGFQMFGSIAISMLGMLVLAPAISHVLAPVLELIPMGVPFEPSIIAGAVLSSDMGGANLAQSIAKSEEMGYFNGLVVASMMGCTTSFSLPFAMGVVAKKQQKLLLTGMMCGIVTIPIGCIFAGIISGIAFLSLIINLVPLIVLAVVITIGLLKVPSLCVKIFKGISIVIKIVIVFGMMVGIVEFLTGYQVIPYVAPIEDGAIVVFNAVVVMSGTFPLVHIIGRVLNRPLKAMGRMIGIKDTAAIGFVASLATSVTTFSLMKNMDDRGVVLNSAFAVSGAFVFAGQLGFTMSVNADFVPGFIFGKLIAGIFAVVLAAWITRKQVKESSIMA